MRWARHPFSNPGMRIGLATLHCTCLQAQADAIGSAQHRAEASRARGGDAPVHAEAAISDDALRVLVLSKCE